MCILCCTYSKFTIENKVIIDFLIETFPYYICGNYNDSNKNNKEIILDMFNYPLFISHCNIYEIFWNLSDDNYLILLQRLNICDDKYYELTTSGYEHDIGKMWKGKEYFYTHYIKPNFLDKIAAYSLDEVEKYKDKYIDFGKYNILKIKECHSLYFL